MKLINNILISAVIIIAGLSSCNDDNPSIDLDGELQITEFSINDVAGVIDHDKQQILVKLPPGSDVTMLTPEIKLSPGATVTPYEGMAQNFSNPVVYTVVNGNLFREYTVSVEVINAYITTFVLDGKYQATINNTTRNIRVTIPYGADLTSLGTYIVYTEGATLTPDSGSTVDLTKAASFTLSYEGYDFVYNLTLSQRDGAVAFVGEALEALHLPMEERTAYEWMAAEYDNCHYISFEGIRNGTVDLSDYDVIWWHYYEPNEWPYAVPATAADAATVQAFSDYLNGGGGLYLSSFAIEYVVDLGLTEYSPANKWGDSRYFIVGDVGEWGISGDGHYDHPIYEGVERDFRPADNAEAGWEVEHDVVMLQGPNVARSNKAAIWNLAASETQHVFTTIDQWEEVAGAIGLASFGWDAAPLNRIAIAEFPRIMNGRGPVIGNGAASYEWWNCGNTEFTNSRRGNIERLTKNILDHLKK